MKSAVRFGTSLIGVFIALLVVWYILNEIDAPRRFDLPSAPLPSTAAGKKAFTELLGLSAPVGTDWEEAGRKAYSEIEAGRSASRDDEHRTENEITNKLASGEYHDAKFLTENREAVDKFLKSAEPYLKRYDQVLANGDLTNSLAPKMSNSFSSVLLFKLLKVRELSWDVAIARGDERVVLDQAKQVWTFTAKSLDGYAPLIQSLIQLTILRSTKSYLQAASQSPGFHAAVKSLPAHSFELAPDTDAIYERSRVWEMYWIGDLLKSVGDQGTDDFGSSAITVHFQKRNQQRILNALNDIWIAGAKREEFTQPWTLQFYPVAERTVMILGSNLAHSRKKMDELATQLKAPLVIAAALEAPAQK